MYAIDIELQTGKKLEGLIFNWAPEEGFVEILNEKTGDRQIIEFDDVKTGVWYSDRVRKIAKSEDLLNKAITEGYTKTK